MESGEEGKGVVGGNAATRWLGENNTSGRERELVSEEQEQEEGSAE